MFSESLCWICFFVWFFIFFHFAQLKLGLLPKKKKKKKSFYMHVLYFLYLLLELLMLSSYLLFMYNEHINRSQQCYNLFKFDKVGVCGHYPRIVAKRIGSIMPLRCCMSIKNTFKLA